MVPAVEAQNQRVHPAFRPLIVMLLLGTPEDEWSQPARSLMRLHPPRSILGLLSLSVESSTYEKVASTIVVLAGPPNASIDAFFGWIAEVVLDYVGCLTEAPISSGPNLSS